MSQNSYSTTQLESRSSLQDWAPMDNGVYVALLVGIAVFLLAIGLFKLGEWAATKDEREILVAKRIKDNLTR